METAAVNVPLHCRGCFSNDTSDLVDIFKIGFDQLYSELTNLPISPDDFYSKFICLTCVAELSHCKKFKAKCVESRAKYFELVIAVKIDENVEPIDENLELMDDLETNIEALSAAEEYFRLPDQNVEPIDEILETKVEILSETIHSPDVWMVGQNNTEVGIHHKENQNQTENINPNPKSAREVSETVDFYVKIIRDHMLSVKNLKRSVNKNLQRRTKGGRTHGFQQPILQQILEIPDVKILFKDNRLLPRTSAVYKAIATEMLRIHQEMKKPCQITPLAVWSYMRKCTQSNLTNSMDPNLISVRKEKFSWENSREMREN